MKREDIRILIVDDEKLICKLFQHSLRKKGYQTDIATDGEEALGLCQLNGYHIIITDLKMPKLDGMSLLRAVKANWPDTEIIVITGYATIELAIEAMKVGASDFILKPVNFQNVFLIVEKCFSHLSTRLENAELRQENNRLQELNLLKDKFLSITNHEMRTPIMVLKGYLEILELMPDADLAERNEISNVLRKTVLEMEESVERMHLLSRLRKQEWYNNSEAVDCATHIREIAGDMERLFSHRSLSLEIDVTDELLLINGSLRGLRIIVRELLQNALKFTPDGGSIFVRSKRVDDTIVLSIEDTGIGIPAEEQEVIFADFYESGNTSHHKTSKHDFLGGGLGIGLGLVREIVSSMFGEIKVESTKGQGACFDIIFPAAKIVDKSIAV